MNAPSFTFGYARVSTDDQDMSLQIKALREYGIPLDQIHMETASGATMNRKELAKMLRKLRSGDTVVVWKLDRLGRTMSGVVEVANQMHVDGVELISITEKIDTTSAMGKAFFHIIVAFAQLERDMISERTKAGMAVRKANGAKFGKADFIVSHPKRLQWFECEYREGWAQDMSATEVIKGFNAIDPKAPAIKSAETYRKWKRKGYPGAMLQEPALYEEPS